MKTYQQADANEAKLWSKIKEQKEHNRKTERINNMGKELHGVELCSEEDIRSAFNKFPDFFVLDS